ncbi:MAG: hypothetical protein RL846_06460 [Deltaproteobacteria bacterium]
MKRHEVQLLRSAGHKQREVAESVSERSVRRIEGEERVEGFDDASAVRKRGVGRPSKVAAFEGTVAAWLEKDPDVMTLELLRRAREDGYEGGKSAFFALVKRLRPKPRGPTVRFEGLPGEFAQHDFGEVDVRFIDGTYVLAVDRALRGLVLGRSNHFGSRSQCGTEVAAIFYSLIESAKLNGLDPIAYLRTAAAAHLADQTVPLPHEIA